MPQSKSNNKLTTIDSYIERLFVPPAAVFEKALRDAAAAGLPEINVSPSEGKLLYLLAKIANARRILEIGMLGGYSTMWLSSALPAKGRLVSLELEEKCAKVARANLKRAGLLSKVDIRVGDARTSLAKMVKAREATFDVVFIDADKEGYPVYLDYALKLTHSGSLILGDNVIRDGKVADSKSKEPNVVAIRKFNAKLAACPELETILVPIVRHNLDGLAIARRR